MYTSSTAAAAASGRKKRDLRHGLMHLQVLLRTAARPVGLSLCMFLLPFVRWFGVPSPFAAALLLAVAAKPTPLMLTGLGASLVLRLVWGVEVDLWQYIGCLGIWLLRQRCVPRAGIETAALGGLAMLPRAVAALVGGQTLDILLSLAALPLGMLASACLRCGMDAMSSTGAPTSGRERACTLLLALLVISGLGYFRVATINLGHVAAVACAIAFACANGSIYGAAGGFCCGFALALGGHDSRLTVALALCGLICGFQPVSRRRFLLIPSALLSSLLAFYVTPLLAPPLGYWAAGIGSALYVFLPAWLRERVDAVTQGTAERAQSMESAFVSQRIAHMREAVHELARALPACEGKELSTGAELGDLMCAQCANRELCWGKSRARTEKMLSALVEMSRRGEEVDEEHLPALIEHGCLRAGVAGELARDMLIQRQRRIVARNKARYERELTLTHLAALSGTLGELGTLAAGESLNDLQAAHVITLALEELRIPARLLYARRVDGHLQAALESEGLLPFQKALDGLLRYLAAEEQLALSVSRAEHGRIELEEVPLYSAAVGTASISAGAREDDGGAVCGDACSAKRCEGGRLLMMLCDGMGHGSEARAQSEKTLELLLLLLEAGYTRHQAITAVNGIMLGAQEGERFSTVDLADVDLWTGDVYSEKLGACASWVVRGNHMKKIDGSSLPLGIMEEAIPTAAQYRLHSGDILVIMSDGVADVFENDDEMKQALSDSLYIQPQRMADALLRNALLAGGGTPRDDMSVMVLLLIDRSQKDGA